MYEHSERHVHVAQIDQMIRHITWQSHKHMLHTLSRPEIDLTMPQMVTLFAIRNAHMCRMSELAEVTHQSAGTLTGIVDRLIEENLVGRVRDVDDRRVVQVTLTNEGENRLSLVEQLLREEMEQRLRGFNSDQLHDFGHLLGLLMDSFSDAHGLEVEHSNTAVAG
jgi:DNA-binding MarR family transcriptional regulator